VAQLAPKLRERPAPTPPGPREDARLLSDYPRLVRRHRIALAGCLGVALLLGLGYLAGTRNSYTSVGSVLVRDPASIVSTSRDSLGLALSMDSEVAVLRSQAVTRQAARTIGSIEPDEVGRRITVSIPPNSRLLQIGFRGNSRRAAIDGANKVAAAYLSVRQAQYDARRADQVERLTGNIKTTTALLDQAKKIAADPGQARPNRGSAGRQAQTFASQIERQNRRIAALKALDTQAGSLTEPASKAAGPKLVNRMVPLATVLALGVLAFVLLLPYLRRRRRINHPNEVRDLPDVRLAMPAPAGLRSPDERVRRKAIPAYLRLWGLVLATERTSPRVVALLPADHRLAARDVAIDLAAASGAQGVPTALVIVGNAPWALLRALSMEDVGDPGDSHRQAVRVLGDSLALPGVTLASLGQPSGMPVREAIREGLTWLGRNYDHIVVLAPPPGTVEHQSLAWAASVPIVVVERRRTRLTDLSETVSVVRAAGAKQPWVLVAGASGSTAAVNIAQRPGPDHPAGAGDPEDPDGSVDPIPAVLRTPVAERLGATPPPPPPAATDRLKGRPHR
jgi:hypothetical protein